MVAGSLHSADPGTSLLSPRPPRAPRAGLLLTKRSGPSPCHGGGVEGYGGGGWATRVSFPGRSIWLCWTLHAVFSASLLPVATPAPSFCLPTPLRDLASLLPSGTPNPPTPHMVHTRKFS